MCGRYSRLQDELLFLAVRMKEADNTAPKDHWRLAVQAVQESVCQVAAMVPEDLGYGSPMHPALEILATTPLFNTAAVSGWVGLVDSLIEILRYLGDCTCEHVPLVPELGAHLPQSIYGNPQSRQFEL